MAGDEMDAPTSIRSDGWKERIYIPTLVAGIVGAGAGLLSKHRKTYGVAHISATYGTNLAIVAGCYCGAREFVRETRASAPDDIVNSVLGGITSGALLGRLQGGQMGAIRYSIIFAIAGTVMDYAAFKLKPFLHTHGSIHEWSLPEWSPIQVLDEEAAAAKRAREKHLFEQRVLGKLTEEES